MRKKANSHDDFHIPQQRQQNGQVSGANSHRSRRQSIQNMIHNVAGTLNTLTPINVAGKKIKKAHEEDLQTLEREW